MLVPKKAATMPKPQWHPPWKLYRVNNDFCTFSHIKVTQLHGQHGSMILINCSKECFLFTLVSLWIVEKLHPNLSSSMIFIVTYHIYRYR